MSSCVARFKNVAVPAIAAELPPEVVSSEFIERQLAPVYEKIGLQFGRLELMSGIKCRRFWPGRVRSSEVATLAAEKALSRVPWLRPRVSAVVHASVCRDFLEPATANIVHDALELSPSSYVFDISNACLGVLNGMLLVGSMIELGQIDCGLVVSGENGKPLLDSTIESLLLDPKIDRRTIKPAFASLTIGSGAAAVVLCRKDLVEDAPVLQGATTLSATQHHALCRGGAEGAFDSGVQSGVEVTMATDSEALLDAGLDLAKSNFSAFADAFGGVSPGEARVMTHQVSRVHHQSLFRSLALSEDDGYVIYDRLGNTGSAALPLATAMAMEEGFVTPGDRILLFGIGSGLSSVMMELRW